MVVPLKDLKEHKSCASCKKIKNIRLFTLNKRTKSGLGSYCLLCHRRKCLNYKSYKPKGLERYDQNT